jgi:SNF2 family DNA or RNA helicase
VKYVPRPYQQRATDFAVEHPRCALWLEMGLGKTSSTLAAIRELLHFGEVSRVLIVGPLRVAYQVWPAEIRKWDEFHGLSFTRLRGVPNWRHTLTHKATDIHLINYENLEWLVETRLKDWPYDLIVLDESSRVKNPSAKRFRALRRVMKARPEVRMIQLTGTPSPNGLVDVWAPAWLLDRGQRLGDTLEAFKRRWFNVSDYGAEPKKFAQEQIEAKLRDIVVSMRAADYLQLPRLVMNEIKVELPDKAMGQYAQLERSMFIELQRVMEHGTEFEKVTAFSSGALTNKCLQLASGAVYLQDPVTGEPSREWAAVHDAKLEALDEVLEEAAGAPVLVVYWFKSDLERLQRRYPHGVVMDKQGTAIERWNRGELPLLFINPGSAGHGLNLQDGGNIMVWFSMQWSLELFQQTNARLHRSGQTKPVYCHLLLARGTLDEDVVLRLQDKASVQAILMERLKARDYGRAA